MRLIRNKIYRAFPELDRFDDERCVRFVNAARRGWVVKGIGISLVLLTGAVITIAPPGLTVLVLRFTSWGTARGNSDLFGLFTTVVLTGCICGPLAGILMRDVLLRWRVRHVLRTRGSCFSCHYSLLGLPIAAGNQVTCPECQTVNEVDEAMTELSSSDAAGPRVSSDPTALNVLKAQAERRLRWWRRTKVALSIAAAVLAACWGGYEYFLRQQAAAAAAARPGIAGLMAYAESLQPVPASPDEPDGWVLLERAMGAKGRVDEQRKSPQQAGNGLFEDYATVYSEPSPNPALAEREQQQAKAAMEAIAAYQAQGVFLEFDAVAGARRCLKHMQVASSAPLFSVNLAGSGPGRTTSSLMNARMTLAARSGDRPQIIAAYRTGLALARMYQMQPAGIGVTLGLIMEQTTQNRLRRLMLETPTSFDAPTLRSLLAARSEQCWDMPLSHPMAGDALCTLDTLAWVFAEPSQVRFGKFSPAIGTLFGGWGTFGAADVPGRLGTFAANQAELAARSATWIQIAGLRASDAASSRLPGESSHVLLSMIDYPPLATLQQRNAMVLARIGTTAMLAVELYRRVHGAPPPTLDVAFSEAALNIAPDPFASDSGESLRYKLIDAASDCLSRPYLLYSVGGDFKDDGGATPPMPYRNETSLSDFMIIPGSRGIDYILNDDR